MDAAEPEGIEEMSDAIYPPLREMIAGCGDARPTSAVAFWVTGDPSHDALGWIHCINSDADRASIVATLREHADALESLPPTSRSAPPAPTPYPGS